MKKDGKDNIVLFPDVERRLTEKGIEALRDKKYTEAISFLEQANALDPDNQDVMAGLVLAYFEAGALRKAKDLCKKMLHTGAGDYFQIIEMYITILIQLHDYKEVTGVLEALLSEQEIPREKKEHFLTLLQFSKRLAENEPPALEDENEREQTEEKAEPGALDFFALTDLKDQVIAGGELAGKNIEPIMPEIADFLKSPKGHPFFKTILLNVLREKGVHDEFAVEKFGRKERLRPAELLPPGTSGRESEIARILSSQLEQIDPVLLESAVSLSERHGFAIYPFELGPTSHAAWAAAFHLTASAYHGNPMDTGRIAEIYSCNQGEVAEAASVIGQVEEISYPII